MINGVKLALLSAFLALPLAAQTPTPGSMPADLVCVFGSYQSQGSPRIGAGVSLAVRASANQGVYSYSSMDLAIIHGKISQSTRTGGAVLLRQVGNLSAFVLGTAGVTSANSATLLSGSFGVLGAYKFTSRPFALIADIQKSNTTGATARFGVAFYFGK